MRIIYEVGGVVQLWLQLDKTGKVVAAGPHEYEAWQKLWVGITIQCHRELCPGDVAFYIDQRGQQQVLKHTIAKIIQPHQLTEK